MQTPPIKTTYTRLASNGNETVVEERPVQARLGIQNNSNETVVEDGPVRRRLAANSNETVMEDGC